MSHQFYCKSTCPHYYPAAGTGETHLVVQLLVEVGDERLILHLLLFRQRHGRRGQALDHCWRFSAVLLAFVAQLLIHRYRLTWRGSKRVKNPQQLGFPCCGFKATDILVSGQIKVILSFRSKL